MCDKNHELMKIPLEFYLMRVQVLLSKLSHRVTAILSLLDSIEMECSRQKSSSHIINCLTIHNTLGQRIGFDEKTQLKHQKQPKIGKISFAKNN